MKKNKYIIVVLLGIIILATMLSTKSLAIEEVRVEYEYIEETNEVVAKIISNVELEDTKPTWTLSDDKKTYTKIYSSNMKYFTPVQDINGNVINIEIDINLVQIAELETRYFYDEDKNEVTVQMISDLELNDTKPTWTLSEDRKMYTKVFTENMEYTTPIQDKWGNIINADIKVTDVKKLELKTEYKRNEETNQVVAKIISNIKLKDTKPTWQLSEDKKTYTKVYTENTKYSTRVESINGECAEIELNIDEIDDQGPQIELEYKYNSDNTVTIYMKSNEKLGDTKPTWKLSDDQKIYEKIYSTDEENYITQVQDIYGNITNVKIVLKKKYEDFRLGVSNVKIAYMYTAYNEVIVQIISSKEFEDTKPTWKLSEDKKTYTKIYYNDEDYTTAIQFIDGERYDVKISIDYFFKIICEKGNYGVSGAIIKGVAGGTDLEYLRFGSGENVLFATFCVHGYEDSWARDGGVLVNIGNNLYTRLINDQDKDIAKNWTIYIFMEVNPDGRRLGYTNQGPGRTTLYSKAQKGIDINRSWQTGNEYKTYTDNRNYNGTAGFQAYEAEYLRDFLLSHKSKNGKTILIDLHGWEDQLIGDEEICKYYKQQYPSCRTTGYGRYGTQYLITWARQNLAAKVALVELPLAKNYEEVNNMQLSNKYINATLEMLRNEK